MIINLIAVDPLDEKRILQYRVPERSRELELLQELFDTHSIEHTTLMGKPRSLFKKRKKKGETR